MGGLKKLQQGESSCTRSIGALTVDIGNPEEKVVRCAIRDVVDWCRGVSSRSCRRLEEDPATLKVQRVSLPELESES